MYGDRITLLEKDKAHFIEVREEARGHKEHYALIEEDALQTVESLSRTIAMYRRLDEQSFDPKQLTIKDTDPVKEANTNRISTNGHLEPHGVYNRLLDSFRLNPAFRSIGEIVKEFQEAGYSVRRDQIRGAVTRGMREHRVVKAQYGNSRKFVFYGLPTWVRSGRYADRSVAPKAAKKLKTREPHFSPQL